MNRNFRSLYLPLVVFLLPTLLLGQAGPTSPTRAPGQPVVTMADSASIARARNRAPSPVAGNVNSVARKSVVDSIAAAPSASSVTAQRLDSMSLATLNKPEFIPASDSLKIPVLDFKNTDIRDILRALGMQYSLNIYLEPEVTGNLSLYLVNISVRNAIDFVIKRGKFSYVVDRGIVKVFKEASPPPPAPQKAPVVFHLAQGLMDIDLKGANAKDVAKMFVDSAGINVVPDSKVDKEITSHIKGMRPEKALKVVFESNGLDVSLSDGVYYVTPQTWGGAPDAKGGIQQQESRRLSLTVGKDGKITLEVNNASLDQLIRSIAMQSGMNIIIYENISGTVTAKFDSISLDDVLRFLLENTKYTFWKDKSIYFLGSREMSQQKSTIVIPLKHIIASEESISKILPPNISKDAVIKFDKEHNSVIVIGSFDIVAQTQEFIEKIDKFVPQVLIEALVVDFNLNKIRDYGVSIFTQGTKDTSSNWMSEKFLPELDLKPGPQRTQRILNSIMQMIGIKQIVDLPSNFRSEIHALETAAIVKVHSTPQIATINGNPASITIGETRYYKLKKETDAPVLNNSAVIGTDERFEVIKFNTELQVTPWVMDDGYVMVKIRPEFNVPQASVDATTPPNVNTRVIESMVRLRNGQTIILGGQRQTQNDENSSGIPFLSSIPVLGWLFSSKTYTKTETQMMIFVTPHVFYRDDNAVSPDDYVGEEVSKIMKQNLRAKNRKTRVDADSTSMKPDSTGKTADLKKKPKKKWHWWWEKDKEEVATEAK